jgi:hypothetical protein
MNCRTAQQLLTFDRPHAPELSSEDRAALGRHLAVCRKCRAVEQAERAIDETLGKAMRDVEVPAGLQRQLHAEVDHLDEEDRRRWWRQAGRYALASAAALLLLIGGGMGWQWWSRPVLDLDQLNRDIIHASINPPSVDEMTRDFQALGVRTILPLATEVNYALCIDHRLAAFQGPMVPMLLFHRVDGQHEESARLFVLSAAQFDLKTLVNPPPLEPGSRYRIEIRQSEGQTYAYVFIHTGENLNWLLLKGSEKAT